MQRAHLPRRALTALVLLFLFGIAGRPVLADTVAASVSAAIRVTGSSASWMVLLVSCSICSWPAMGDSQYLRSSGP